MNILRICSRWSFSQGLNLVILHRTSWETGRREGRGSEFADNLADEIKSGHPGSIKAGGSLVVGEAFGSLVVPSDVRFHSNSDIAVTPQCFLSGNALLLYCSSLVVEQQ